MDEFRRELVSVLKTCRDRREARVMLAQTQLLLARERVSEPDRDRFWKALLRDMKSVSEEFAATDVFAAAIADVTLFSIRCGRQSYVNDD